MRRDPRQEAIRALVAPNRAVTQVIPVEESEYPLSFLKNFPISQYAYLLPEERWFAFLSVVGRQKPGDKQSQPLKPNSSQFMSDLIGWTNGVRGRSVLSDQ